MLKIVKWPSSTLKQRSEGINSTKVKLPSGEPIDLQKLADDMREVMTAAGGVGLSAIQVGIPVALVVTKFPGLEVLINPFVQTRQVVETKATDGEAIRTSVPLGKLVDVEEGCLSLPGFQETVKRFNKVNVLFETIEHVAKREELGERPYFMTDPLFFYKLSGIAPKLTEGFAAQCIQHEAEHVRGEFFLDHVKPARRDAIRAALRRAR